MAPPAIQSGPETAPEVTYTSASPDSPPRPEPLTRGLSASRSKTRRMSFSALTDVPDFETHVDPPCMDPGGIDALMADMSFDPVVRASQVYCSGELLTAVQLSGLFEDSKEFVDMPMKDDPEVILSAFQSLSAADRRDPTVLKAFLMQHFTPPGSDLIPFEPSDHRTEPSLLRLLAGHGHYQKWATELNDFWKQLVRKVHDDAYQHPQRYSILRRRFPIVIPGGRFRESYYWDSYWIVLGLLACDMSDTARGLVQNLLDDVSTFGFVPNGGRIYYLNRSQPPMLSEMVMALVEHDPTGIDEKFVASALSVLETEYAFWMTEGERAVRLFDPHNPSGQAFHVLNRYWTLADYPRPESFKEDLYHAGQAVCSSGFYANCAAGAESGWDFTSRWMAQSSDGSYSLRNIATSGIIPVDLNTFLYRMERNMARLHDYLLRRQTTSDPWHVPPDSTLSWESYKAQSYALASERRAEAMDRMLWSDADGCWRDMWTDGIQHRTSGVRSASDFCPLWGRVLNNPVLSSVAPERKATVFTSLTESSLIQVGGISTTNVDTHEQWDRANAWSPVQHMMIEGLETLGGQGAVLARRLACEWLESNYLGWANTGFMYEKYNATIPGARGEGGEYYPQVGFGWTNGVVLHLLKTYCRELAEGRMEAP